MAISFLTNLNEEEFKSFLKQSLLEILGTQSGISKSPEPDVFDIKQAAEFLHLKINTLYEKTSRKLIPHFKRGNKLYFNRAQLQVWVEEGKVKTRDELQAEASTYTLFKK